MSAGPLVGRVFLSSFFQIILKCEVYFRPRPRDFKWELFEDTELIQAKHNVSERCWNYYIADGIKMYLLF